MKVFLLLGGNLGNPIENLKQATLLIEERIGTINRRSSFYETEPVGFTHENNFVNQVLVCETTLDPLAVLSKALEIEHEMGRVRNGAGYEARTLDIDLLYYDDLVLDTEALILPHPRMHHRLFTLIPLAEVASEYIHPVFSQSSKKMLEACPDKSNVIKL